MLSHFISGRKYEKGEIKTKVRGALSSTYVASLETFPSRKSLGFLRKNGYPALNSL